MALGASVGHRFGHAIIFRPYYILSQIPPVSTERKGDGPGNADQVFGLDAILELIARWWPKSLVFICWPIPPGGFLQSLPMLPRRAIWMIVAPRSCIRIPQIYPASAFLLQHPSDLSEDLRQLAYVGLRALLLTDLPLYSIVSQSESKEARSHSNQLTRSEVFLIPPARPPAEPDYSSINSPPMFILLCTNLWQPAQSKIKFVISSRRSFVSNGVI